MEQWLLMKKSPTQNKLAVVSWQQKSASNTYNDVMAVSLVCRLPLSTQWFRDPLLFLSCGSTFLPCHLLHLARRRKEKIKRKCNNFWKSGPTNAIFTFSQRKLTSIAYLDAGWPENLVLNLGNASQWWCYIIEYLSQGSHRNFHCFPSPPS